MDMCIQCRRTAEELGEVGILLTRPRPLLRRSEYQVCLECARRIREEQDARLAAAMAGV